MPQFLDRECFGYRVFLRPTDPFRKIFRIKLPDLNLFLLPYLWGTDIMFNLNIQATQSALPRVLKYEWQLYAKEEARPRVTGNGIVDMTTARKRNTILDLGHFSFRYEYRLDITIETESGEKCQKTVVDFETSSRTAFQMFLLGALLTIIGVVIGYFARG